MEFELQKDCKINMNLHFRKFINELRQINKLKFKCYQQYILGNLLNLIQIIQFFNIHHSKQISSFKYNFHITNYDDYQLFHIQAQCILIDVKNDIRSKITCTIIKKISQQQSIKGNLIKEIGSFESPNQAINQIVIKNPSFRKIINKLNSQERIHIQQIF
ncbi:hypothetical protein pb186bvf_001752 [Paramecium bursaria]